MSDHEHFLILIYILSNYHFNVCVLFSLYSCAISNPLLWNIRLYSVYLDYIQSCNYYF